MTKKSIIALMTLGMFVAQSGYAGPGDSLTEKDWETIRTLESELSKIKQTELAQKLKTFVADLKAEEEVDHFDMAAKLARAGHTQAAQAVADLLKRDILRVLNNSKDQEGLVDKSQFIEHAKAGKMTAEEAKRIAHQFKPETPQYILISAYAKLLEVPLHKLDEVKKF